VELLQISEAERIAGDSGIGVSLLGDVERLGIDEVRLEPGGVAPPAHIHPHHSQCFFNFHAPSCGFGDYLRGRNPGFDQHDPPPGGGGDPASVIALVFPGRLTA
jgi:hypothetical protein